MDDRVPTNKECGLRAVIGTGRALWSRASSQSMIPPRNVNLAACQDAKDRFPRRSLRFFPSAGLAPPPRKIHPVVCGNERWDVSEPCNTASEAVGNRPLGGFGRPGCLSLPATPSPRGISPNSSPGVLPCPACWLVIATSPDGAPDGSPCAPGGSEMRNLAGRAGERRGCRIEEIRWDPLEPPLSVWTGLCWFAGARLWLSDLVQTVTENEKPAGRGGPGVAFGFCPWMWPSHETARCYAGVHCTKVSWPVFRRRSPPTSHTNKGRARCCTHMDSGSWNNSPSGFPRLASDL